MDKVVRFYEFIARVIRVRVQLRGRQCTVTPSCQSIGVGKLIAVDKKWVTAVEVVIWLTYATYATERRTLLNTGFLQSARMTFDVRSNDEMPNEVSSSVC
jgi:hypothetical protein